MCMFSQKSNMKKLIYSIAVVEMNTDFYSAPIKFARGMLYFIPLYDLGIISEWYALLF